MPGFRHAPEVLSDCCEQELIASAVHSAQPQARQMQDAFEVREQHLHLLSILARLLVKAGLGDGTSSISCRFVDAAMNLSNRRLGTAAGLHRATRAIGLPGLIND